MTKIKRSKRVNEVVELSHSKTAEIKFDYSDGKLQSVRGGFRLYYGDRFSEYEYKAATIEDEELLDEFQSRAIGWIEEKLLEKAIDKVRVNNS